MTGINKRSTDPKADQKKMKVNPAYNTSALMKSVFDVIGPILGGDDKDKKKSKSTKRSK